MVPLMTSSKYAIRGYRGKHDRFVIAITINLVQVHHQHLLLIGVCIGTCFLLIAIGIASLSLRHHTSKQRTHSRKRTQICPIYNLILENLGAPLITRSHYTFISNDHMNHLSRISIKQNSSQNWRIC